MFKIVTYVRFCTVKMNFKFDLRFFYERIKKWSKSARNSLSKCRMQRWFFIRYLKIEAVYGICIPRMEKCLTAISSILSYIFIINFRKVTLRFRFIVRRGGAADAIIASKLYGFPAQKGTSNDTTSSLGPIMETDHMLNGLDFSFKFSSN